MKKVLPVIQWVVGCFIMIMGFANIANSPFGAIFLLISGIVILPPILKMIKEKFKMNGNIISITICTVAFILGIAITGNSSTANNANEIAMPNEQNTATTNSAINNISDNNIQQNEIVNETVNSVIENSTIVENSVNTQTTNEIKTTEEKQTTKKTVEDNDNTNTSKTKSNKTTSSSTTEKATTKKQETTSSNSNTQTKTQKTQTTQTTTSSTSEGGYIVNKNSHVFHKPNCPSVKRMNESNKIYSSKSRAELINEGCKSCNNCNS